MKCLSERYVKVLKHKRIDICTLEVAIPTQGDEMEYAIDDKRFSGTAFNHPEEAVDAIDELIR